jgi:hypothetical protein
MSARDIPHPLGLTEEGDYTKKYSDILKHPAEEKVTAPK